MVLCIVPLNPPIKYIESLCTTAEWPYLLTESGRPALGVSLHSPHTKQQRSETTLFLHLETYIKPHELPLPLQLTSHSPHPRIPYPSHFTDSMSKHSLKVQLKVYMTRKTSDAQLQLIPQCLLCQRSKGVSKGTLHVCVKEPVMFV